MVIGCPGSGKSWVCDQVKHLFHYVHHDLFIGMAGAAYVEEIVRQSRIAARPILIESPFSISEIKDPLERMGLRVTPVFIQEHPEVIRQRYWSREHKDIPQGHLTRQETYRRRAIAWSAFQGTSSEVLIYLKQQAQRHVPT